MNRSCYDNKINVYNLYTVHVYVYIRTVYIHYMYTVYINTRKYRIYKV